MKTRRRIRLIGGVVSPFILFVSLVSLPLARNGWTTAARFPDKEETFEFTNNETADAYDLHIEWSRAVAIKQVTPFKKQDGSGTNRANLSKGVVKPNEKASITVTWDGTAPTVKEWWWTKENGDRLGQVKTGNPITPNAPVTSSSTTSEGLRIVRFDSLQGRFIVNLPDDMTAGDTISGTVMAEPKGQTEEERAKNMAELNGYVIELETPKKPDGTGGANVKAAISAAIVPVVINLPPIRPPAGVSSPGSDTVVIRLTSTTGSFTTGGPATVPIEMVSLSLQSVTPLNTFQLPTIGQQGRPIEIFGPFDGNSSNTKLMYGPKGTPIQDFEKNTENVTGGFGLLQPLAESPRKTVFTAPTNVTGPIELHLKEGNKETAGTYRNVGVNLSAPKTNLLKGERTTLTIQVTGLQGITKAVPLTLESHGVITMEGGMFQPLMIQPSAVGADGRYTTTRGITGVQAGGWTATATVVTQPFNIVLRDPDPPQTVLINSFTGDYVFCGSRLKLTGTGQIRRDGCALTLTDSNPDRDVKGTFNGCVPVDNSRLSTFLSPGTISEIKATVTGTQPPKTKVYFNPLGRPAPPVQDVSAFATCP